MSVKDMNKHTHRLSIIPIDAVENSSTIIPVGMIIATRMSWGKIVTASLISKLTWDLKALFLLGGGWTQFSFLVRQAQLIEKLGSVQQRE